MRLLLLLALVVVLAFASSASAIVPPAWKNCTRVHKTYPHGVGKVGARDKTASGSPVTTFKRSNALYLKAKHLDRDKDGVACESA